MKANDLENAAPPLDAKRTLVGGHRAAGPSGHVPSLTATVVGTATPQPAARVELEDFDFGERAQDSSPAVAGRTTVLPRTGRGPGEVAFELRPRFHPLKTIGEGAMGEVQLVRDNDIRRTVAVKRLLGGTQSESALLRFADEIRVVGQLEHPGIVPVYDVGRAEDGQLYLVMKHLQGETMENIISRLQAGEPAYVERFTAEYRVRLFLGILDAMVYAHARGVLHRDIKPANIMIGPYGEVTMMDWGIAKPIASKRASSDDVDSLAHTALDSQDERLLETQQGSLAGTPLYMSPEQAAGKNDELDERSDVYALCVVLYEWLVLQHPLRDKKSVTEVLATLVLHDYAPEDLFGPAQHAKVPMEYIWIVYQGLVRDREKRFQTVKELETRIKSVQDGKIKIQCHVTLAKSYAHRFAHWIDEHFALYTFLFRTVKLFLIAVLFGVIGLALWKGATWFLMRS